MKPSTNAKPRRVVLLAYNEMNLLDLSGPLQTLVTANRRACAADSTLYETIVASVDGGLITTGSGLQVMTSRLSELDKLAIHTIIVPGGCKGDAFYAPEQLVAWISQRAATVTRLCSVCTGAFLLAAAGQLDGRRVATHWDWVDRLLKLHPALEVDADKIFVKDGSVWTSAGVTAGIDLTLALIEEDYGHQIAIETARQLVMFIKRSGGQSQFSVPLKAQSHTDHKFAELHAWVAAHLGEDLRVERLAEQAGMTPRTFARIYVSLTGRTPAKMVEAMRLETACHALEESDLPLKTIAMTHGYLEEQNLHRVFQRQLGISPTEYRQRFSAHNNAVRLRT